MLWPFTYPPPLAIIYFLLTLTPHSIRVFETFILLAAIAMGIWLARAMTWRGFVPVHAYGFAALTLLFSYPLAFEFRVANLEMVLFVFVAAGVWLFFSERENAAAILFGAAAAMKYYPVIFLGLFLAKKRYLPILVGLTSAIGVMLLGLAVVTPSFRLSLRGAREGLQFFKNEYVLQRRFAETPFDHSIFSQIKSLVHRPWLPTPESSHILMAYLGIVTVVGAALFFLRIRKLPVINLLLCLTIAAITLPPVSYDYTLLYLYIPFAAVVLRIRVPNVDRRLVTLAMVLFAIVFSYETEFMGGLLLFDAQIKFIALAFLFVLALVYPLPDHDRPLPGSKSTDVLVETLSS